MTPEAIPPQHNEAVGTVLDGKYEVLDRLGGGGMGEVYLVHHVHLEEKRVIKILRPDRVGDPDAQKRFLREARFATQIKHAHVAILYDYSRLEDGSFYMVWEFIEGEDVGERLRRDGPFSVAEAVDLAIQALDGLQAIHAAGMIHRDISPDNLMTFEDGRGRRRLKIIDLGLAKNLEPDPDHEVTQDGMFMGKLLYCAPEQAGVVKGETLDHRTDLYSFSLVLYEMLCGQRPFEAETPQGAIFKRLSENPVPLSERGVSIPGALEQVVLRGLERERDDRFPDAAAYIDALERVRRAFDGVSTREVQVVDAGSGAMPPPPPGADPAERAVAGSRELSKAERDDLLAQIERAAERVEKGSKTTARIDAAIAAGRLDEARRLFDQLRSTHARARGLEALEERLTQAEARAEEESAAESSARAAEDEERRDQRERRRRAIAEALARAETAARTGPVEEARSAVAALVVLAPDHPERAALEARVAELEGRENQGARVEEAAEMVRRYLQKKQLPLARLALETFVELAPEHPQRGELEQWVEMLADEVEEDRRAEAAYEKGREALDAGDARGARRARAQLEKLGSELAERLGEEIDRTEAEERRGSELTEHRERIEEALEEGRFEEVQEELEELADLGAAKVTLDLYRSRLQEERERARRAAQVEAFAEAVRERLDQGDFRGAREIVGELQRTVPDTARIAELLDEVADQEQAETRGKAVEQGLEQVERFIEAGDADSARLALKLLLQMDPENRRRRQLEKRIAKL